MLLSSTNAFVPGWVTEGLAEMFMTAILKGDGSIIVGATNPARRYSMTSQSRWTVEEMLVKDNQKVLPSEEIERYTRGWALVHYLWLSGERKGQYVKFIEDLNQGGDQLAAGRKAFGDLGKLDGEVDGYLRHRSLPTSMFTAQQLKAPTDVAVRPLSEGEQAMIGMRMESVRGVDKESGPKLYARAQPVAARYPGDPIVQTWFAEMAYDAGEYAASSQAADRALAAAPGSLMAMVYKGRVAAQAAVKSEKEADWQTARSWFLKANRVDPNHPLPFVLFYDSFTAAGQLPPPSAVNGLYRAVVLVPQDLNLRTRAAIALIRDNDIAKARTVLAPAAFYPHNKPGNSMAQLIAAIDEKMDSKALLKRAAELELAGQNEFTAPPKDEDEDSGKSGGDKSGPVQPGKGK